jgi:hypothetical protein
MAPARRLPWTTDCGWPRPPSRRTSSAVRRANAPAKPRPANAPARPRPASRAARPRRTPPRSILRERRRRRLRQFLRPSTRRRLRRFPPRSARLRRPPCRRLIRFRLPPLLRPPVRCRRSLNLLRRNGRALRQPPPRRRPIRSSSVPDCRRRPRRRRRRPHPMPRPRPSSPGARVLRLPPSLPAPPYREACVRVRVLRQPPSPLHSACVRVSKPSRHRPDKLRPHRVSVRQRPQRSRRRR